MDLVLDTAGQETNRRARAVSLRVLGTLGSFFPFLLQKIPAVISYVWQAGTTAGTPVIEVFTLWNKRPYVWIFCRETARHRSFEAFHGRSHGTGLYYGWSVL